MTATRMAGPRKNGGRERAAPANRWCGAGRLWSRAVGTMVSALVPSAPGQALPDICQKLRHAQLHPAPQPNLATRSFTPPHNPTFGSAFHQ